MMYRTQGFSVQVVGQVTNVPRRREGGSLIALIDQRQLSPFSGVREQSYPSERNVSTASDARISKRYTLSFA